MSPARAVPRPVGLYLHVPYCRTICPYCDFNVHLAKGASWDALGRAMDAEFLARAPAFGAMELASIYFGGGTPSLASPHWIGDRLRCLEDIASIAHAAEITLEVEPDTASLDVLRAYRGLGINRVSLGWQSTHDALLKRLGRGHDAAASAECLHLCRRAGFERISVDLIFGVPGQTLEHLQQDLESLIALGPEHVSTYSLTFHEGTPFHRLRAQGRLDPVDEDLEIAMMDLIVEQLGAAGIERYEVSNFARSGMRAVHNGSYWTGQPYLGLGPGAHSYLRDDWDAGWRWEGTRTPEAYVSAWEHPPSPGRPAEDSTVSWVESLTPDQLLAERFICALRTTDGLDLSAPPVAGARHRWRDAIRRAEAEGWVSVDGERLRPTQRGLQYADSLAGLFI